MSAYISKVLMERGLVARVYLVCKNEGMRDNWVKTLRNFQITPEIVRVFDLERTSLNSAAETAVSSDILDMFRDLRPNDLVIVDECHHFRNRLAQRSDALHTFLRGPPNTSEGRPFALLLTATPISTGVKHLNALVGLVSDEELERVEEIAFSQGAISVPLGGILRWFGTPAKDGHRGLQHRDERLYFPKLITATKRYRSKLAPVFRALSEYRGILADVVRVCLSIALTSRSIARSTSWLPGTTNRRSRVSARSASSPSSQSRARSYSVAPAAGLRAPPEKATSPVTYTCVGAGTVPRPRTALMSRRRSSTTSCWSH